MTTSDKKVPSPFDLSGRPSIFSSDPKFDGRNDKKKTTESMTATDMVPKCQTRVHKRVTKYVIKEEKK
jgi:hypothetical protein